MISGIIIILIQRMHLWITIPANSIKGVPMRHFLNLMILFMLLFAATDIASAMQDLPFKRIIFTPEWGMKFSSKASIDSAINNISYMNADAMTINVYSEYFEAVRDPAKESWDTRASWNMLEYAIEKAHSKNIQAHVLITVNSLSVGTRAEYRLWGTKIVNGTVYTKYNVNSSYNVPAGTRLEMANPIVSEYEIGLVTFIAKHYPTLDGIHIEEPFYTAPSYSQEIIDRVKAKYNGYDIVGKSDFSKTECRGSSMAGTNHTICPTFAKIYDVERDVFNEFFTKLSASVKANKANPNLLFSANAANYYRPLHGFDPEYMSDNNLLDWYAAQTNSASLGGFKNAVINLKTKINGLPAVPVAYITWSSLYPDANQAFLDQIAKTCEYDGDAEGIFAEYWSSKVVAGNTAKEGLHNLAPSSLCGFQSTIVDTPTLSVPTGNYSSPQNITISTSTAGATIRYTTDGTTPSETSRIYTSAIPISSTTTLKARAFKTNLTPSFVTIATYTITPSQPINNLINNPGFESGKTPWLFYTNGVGTFSVEPPTYAGINSAKIALSTIGTNMQLYQPGVALEPNTRYQLSFAAYSNTGHDIRVRLFKQVTPYTPYGLDYTANLGTNWAVFTTQFTTSGFASNVTDARLQFYLIPFATAEDVYYIDNVKLEKIMVNYSINDLNNDAVVDKRDLDIIYIHFNENVSLSNQNYDVKNDGIIDIFDLVEVTNNIR